VPLKTGFCVESEEFGGIGKYQCGSLDEQVKKTSNPW
jgi:hypothetical protein